MRVAGKNEIVREVMQNDERRGAAAAPFHSRSCVQWPKLAQNETKTEKGIMLVYGRMQ